MLIKSIIKFLINDLKSYLFGLWKGLFGSFSLKLILFFDLIFWFIEFLFIFFICVLSFGFSLFFLFIFLFVFLLVLINNLFNKLNIIIKKEKEKIIHFFYLKCAYLIYDLITAIFVNRSIKSLGLKKIFVYIICSSFLGILYIKFISILSEIVISEYFNVSIIKGVNTDLDIKKDPLDKKNIPVEPVVAWQNRSRKAPAVPYTLKKEIYDLFNPILENRTILNESKFDNLRKRLSNIIKPSPKLNFENSLYNKFNKNYYLYKLDPYMKRYILNFDRWNELINFENNKNKFKNKHYFFTELDDYHYEIRNQRIRHEFSSKPTLLERYNDRGIKSKPFLLRSLNKDLITLKADINRPFFTSIFLWPHHSILSDYVTSDLKKFNIEKNRESTITINELEIESTPKIQEDNIIFNFKKEEEKKKIIPTLSEEKINKLFLLLRNSLADLQEPSASIEETIEAGDSDSEEEKFTFELETPYVSKTQIHSSFKDLLKLKEATIERFKSLLKYAIDLNLEKSQIKILKDEINDLKNWLNSMGLLKDELIDKYYAHQIMDLLNEFEIRLDEVNREEKIQSRFSQLCRVAIDLETKKSWNLKFNSERNISRILDQFPQFIRRYKVLNHILPARITKVNKYQTLFTIKIKDKINILRDEIKTIKNLLNPIKNLEVNKFSVLKNLDNYSLISKFLDFNHKQSKLVEEFPISCLTPNFINESINSHFSLIPKNWRVRLNILPNQVITILDKGKLNSFSSLSLENLKLRLNLKNHRTYTSKFIYVYSANGLTELINDPKYKIIPSFPKENLSKAQIKLLRTDQSIFKTLRDKREARFTEIANILLENQENLINPDFPTLESMTKNWIYDLKNFHKLMLYTDEIKYFKEIFFDLMKDPSQEILKLRCDKYLIQVFISDGSVYQLEEFYNNLFKLFDEILDLFPTTFNQPVYSHWSKKDLISLLESSESVFKHLLAYTRKHKIFIKHTLFDNLHAQVNLISSYKKFVTDVLDPIFTDTDVLINPVEKPIIELEELEEFFPDEIEFPFDYSPLKKLYRFLVLLGERNLYTFSTEIRKSMENLINLKLITENTFSKFQDPLLEKSWKEPISEEEIRNLKNVLFARNKLNTDLLNQFIDLSNDSESAWWSNEEETDWNNKFLNYLSIWTKNWYEWANHIFTLNKSKYELYCSDLPTYNETIFDEIIEKILPEDFPASVTPTIHFSNMHEQVLSLFSLCLKTYPQGFLEDIKLEASYEEILNQLNDLEIYFNKLKDNIQKELSEIELDFIEQHKFIKNLADFSMRVTEIKELLLITRSLRSSIKINDHKIWLGIFEDFLKLNSQDKFTYSTTSSFEKVIRKLINNKIIKPTEVKLFPIFEKPLFIKSCNMNSAPIEDLEAYIKKHSFRIEAMTKYFKSFQFKNFKNFTWNRYMEIMLFSTRTGIDNSFINHLTDWTTNWQSWAKYMITLQHFKDELSVAKETKIYLLQEFNEIITGKIFPQEFLLPKFDNFDNEKEHSIITFLYKLYEQSFSLFNLCLKAYPQGFLQEINLTISFEEILQQLDYLINLLNELETNKLKLLKEEIEIIDQHTFFRNLPGLNKTAKLIKDLVLNLKNKVRPTMFFEEDDEQLIPIFEKLQPSSLSDDESIDFNSKDFSDEESLGIVDEPQSFVIPSNLNLPIPIYSEEEKFRSLSSSEQEKILNNLSIFYEEEEQEKILNNLLNTESIDFNSKDSSDEIEAEVEPLVEVIRPSLSRGWAWLTLTTTNEEYRLKLAKADEETRLEIAKAIMAKAIMVKAEEYWLNIAKVEEETRLELAKADEETRLELAKAEEEYRLNIAKAEEEYRLKIAKVEEETRLEIARLEAEVRLSEEYRLEMAKADEEYRLNIAQLRVQIEEISADIQAPVEVIPAEVQVNQLLIDEDELPQLIDEEAQVQTMISTANKPEQLVKFLTKRLQYEKPLFIALKKLKFLDLEKQIEIEIKKIRAKEEKLQLYSLIKHYRRTFSENLKDYLSSHKQSEVKYKLIKNLRKSLININYILNLSFDFPIYSHKLLKKSWTHQLSAEQLMEMNESLNHFPSLTQPFYREFESTLILLSRKNPSLAKGNKSIIRHFDTWVKSWNQWAYCIISINEKKYLNYLATYVTENEYSFSEMDNIIKKKLLPQNFCKGSLANNLLFVYDETLSILQFSLKSFPYKFFQEDITCSSSFEEILNQLDVLNNFYSKLNFDFNKLSNSEKQILKKHILFENMDDIIERIKNINQLINMGRKIYDLNFIDPERQLVRNLRLLKKQDFLIELDENMFQSTKRGFFYPLSEEIEILISDIKNEGLPLDNLFNEFNKRPKILQLALTKNLSEDQFMEFAEFITNQEKRIDIILKMFNKNSENQKKFCDFLFKWQAHRKLWANNLSHLNEVVLGLDWKKNRSYSVIRRLEKFMNEIDSKEFPTIISGSEAMNYFSNFFEVTAFYLRFCLTAYPLNFLEENLELGSSYEEMISNLDKLSAYLNVIMLLEKQMNIQEISDFNKDRYFTKIANLKNIIENTKILLDVSRSFRAGNYLIKIKEES